MDTLEVVVVDENGSGLEFRALLNPNLFESLMDISSYDLRPKGSNCVMTLRSNDTPVYVRDDFKTLSTRIKNF